MARELTRPARVSVDEFDRIFESVKNWGVWGLDDELGTLNYVTARRRREAAALVRSGRTVSMAIPINKVAGPDNPNPAAHFIAMGHDVPVGGGESFGMCYLGMMSHGDCHTHVDALNHVAYKGLLYNGKDAVATLTSQGSSWGSIAAYAQGIVGRGVLLDAARHRGVKWLEPGEAVGRAELEAIEAAEGVTLGEGDFLVFRTGHHARRLELGPWDNGGSSGGRGQGRHRCRRRPLPARAQGGRLSARRRRRDRAGRRRDHPLPDPRTAARGDGHAYLGQPPARGSGEGLRRGGALGVPGRRLSLAPARRDGIAVEPDRPLLEGGDGSPAAEEPPGVGQRKASGRRDMEKRFVGKVALVTGATNGIGQAAAVRLAAEGAVVGVNQRPTGDPSETLRLIAAVDGDGFPVVADMRDPAQVIDMVHEVARRGGRLDYLVSNAAVNPFKPWYETTLEDFDLLFETNVRGTWTVCTEAAKQMIAEGHGGAICMVSSISAHVGSPGQVAYCGTKGAISMLGKALGAVLGRRRHQGERRRTGSRRHEHERADVR